MAVRQESLPGLQGPPKDKGLLTRRNLLRLGATAGASGLALAALRALGLGETTRSQSNPTPVPAIAGEPLATATGVPVPDIIPTAEPTATVAPTFAPSPTHEPFTPTPTKPATQTATATEVVKPIATPDIPKTVDWTTMTPEEMKEHVKSNIEAFMNLPAEDLVKLSQGTPFAIQYTNGLRPAPLFHNVTGDGSDSYIGKPNDPKHRFPVVTAITDRINSDSNVLLDVSAINLGQQIVAVETSKGTLRMRVGRVGYFAGESDSPSGLIRGTYPVLYGWDADPKNNVASIKNSSVESISRPEQDVIYPLRPIPGTFEEAMTKLGKHIADGVIVLQLGFGTSRTPSADLQKQAAALNYPTDFFNDWLKANYASIHKLNKTLRALTLSQAKQAGYVLYEAGRPTVQSPIPDTLKGKTKEQLIAELPFGGQHITADTMTLEELSQIPFSPGSQWMFTSSNPLIK